MNWVRLTRPDGTMVWLNLDRFDTVTVDEGTKGTTQVIATLSDTEEDILCVEVKETPEEFLK